jgi:hypothetical protein
MVWSCVVSDKGPDSPMRLALRAREARLRRGVEEMQWQVRRFRKTMQKINEAGAPAPAADPPADRPEQPTN